MAPFITLALKWGTIWLGWEIISTVLGVVLTIVGIGYIIYCLYQNHKRY